MASHTRSGSAVDAKWNGLNIVDVPYKHVRGVPLMASILVPANIQAGKAPVVVHWHGGGLMLGDRLFPDWYADWFLALGLKHNAIAITPDYQLLPESKGVDQLQDIEDFFTWLLKPDNLAQYLPEGVEPDTKHLLVGGESAGGWFSIQSGFVAPSSISAIIAQYPMIELRAPHYTESFRKPLMDPPVPQLPVNIVHDHLKALKGDEVVLARMPPEKQPIMAASFQNGIFGQLFGDQTELYPIERLEHATHFPPLWVMHGEADIMVPVDGTHKFAATLQSRFPDNAFHLTIRPGEAHGFDAHEVATGMPASLETDWVKEGVDFVERSWPIQ